MNALQWADSKSKCHSCKHGRVAKTHTRTIISCGWNSDSGTLVPNDVLECTKFAHVNNPSYYEFEKLAWTIRTDKKGATVGFAPPKQRE